MNFRETYNKLESVYRGRYFSMYYELIHYAGGRTETICSLYVETPRGIYKGSTWDEALKELDKVTNPEKYIEEMPEV